MSTKILGWPEPTEVGGHMVKRSDGDLSNRRAVFTCVDCGLKETGSVLAFEIGIDGCPMRPESLNHISIGSPAATEGMSAEERARASAAHWLDYAKRIGLPVDSWTEVYHDPFVCARFAWGAEVYELRYGQRGSHGSNHIHAIKVED